MADDKEGKPEGMGVRLGTNLLFKMMGGVYSSQGKNDIRVRFEDDTTQWGCCKYFVYM